MALRTIRIILDTLFALSALFISPRDVLLREGSARAISEQVQVMHEQVQVMQQQVEMAKSAASGERRYAAVIARSSMDALAAPLSHKKLVTLKYTNRSNHTESYQITIKTTGFGVCETEDCAGKQLINDWSCDKGMAFVTLPTEHTSALFTLCTHVTYQARRPWLFS